MRRIKILRLMPLLFLLGCASGNEANAPCDFVASEFLSGSQRGNPLSEWDCRDANQVPFSFAYFEDGTALDTRFGQLTWRGAGCGVIDYFFAGGEGNLIDLNREGATLTGSEILSGSLQDIVCQQDLQPENIFF